MKAVMTGTESWITDDVTSVYSPTMAYQRM